MLTGGEDSKSTFSYHHIGGMYLAVLRGKFSHVFSFLFFKQKDLIQMRMVIILWLGLECGLRWLLALGFFGNLQSCWFSPLQCKVKQSKLSLIWSLISCLYSFVLFLIFNVDSCGIPKTAELIMYRSAMVPPYWIWSRFHFSSPQNVEVSFFELACRTGVKMDREKRS